MSRDAPMLEDDHTGAGRLAGMKEEGRPWPLAIFRNSFCDILEKARATKASRVMASGMPPCPPSIVPCLSRRCEICDVSNNRVYSSELRHHRQDAR